MVEVLPDVAALNRALHYVESDNLPRELCVGDVVRVPLNGRRVRGWVTAVGVEAEPGRPLESVAKLTGHGTDREVMDLCRWAAWRWVGRLPTILSAVTPDRAVRTPSQRVPRHADTERSPGLDAALVRESAVLADRGPGTHLLTVSPTSDLASVACGVASVGQTIVVVPNPSTARHIESALRGAGATVARWPGGAAETMSGHTVVGGRGAVWAPAPHLAAIVVLDEHDEALQNESSPTWHARELAIERARRCGVPCILVSPMPSLEARRAAETRGSRSVVSTARRRAGWARLVVVDRREDDPRTGMFSPRFVADARRARESGETVLCILNRVGRARLLACARCGTVAECEACGASVRSDGDVLECPRCGTVRPKVCLECGGFSMKVLRMGVTKARDDLQTLLREPVVEVTSATDPGAQRGAGVVIGTVAALHRALERSAGDPEVGLLCFLDFDQELLATRYRASEEALALVVAASRVVGGRSGGRVLLQTRRPAHPVTEAAQRADPDLLAALEWPRREMLGLPPAASVAAVGGEAAAAWIAGLRDSTRVDEVEVLGPNDGWWLVRAEDPSTLAEVAGAVERPRGRLRLRVDPMNLPV